MTNWQRPPIRRINTYAELDALPLGTIIIEEHTDQDWRTDPCPEVLVRIAIGRVVYWLYRGADEPAEDIDLPVIVVWEPLRESDIADGEAHPDDPDAARDRDIADSNGVL